MYEINLKLFPLNILKTIFIYNTLCNLISIRRLLQLLMSWNQEKINKTYFINHQKSYKIPHILTMQISSYECAN